MGRGVGRMAARRGSVVTRRRSRGAAVSRRRRPDPDIDLRPWLAASLIVTGGAKAGRLTASESMRLGYLAMQGDALTGEQHADLAVLQVRDGAAKAGVFGRGRR